MAEHKTEMADLEQQLAPFLRYNPYSSVQKWEQQDHIVNPWNDPSISFVLQPDTAPDLIATLNKLILPPHFSALYHLESNTMEFIYTLLENTDPCNGRKFEFALGDKTYYCRFDDASQPLLLLSKLFIPTGEDTGTDFRNLWLLKLYQDNESQQDALFERDFFAGRRPVSFFVNGFEEFQEEQIITLSKHINFFVGYYDRDAPRILIHTVKTEDWEAPKQLQYLQVTFPENISTRHQDLCLLDLAYQASSVRSRLQFLYYYQILEYAAFYYIDEETRRSLLTILNTPDIHSKPHTYISRILETVNVSSRQEEVSKIQRVVNMACDPECIWKELQENMAYFTTTQQFDGGFIVEPLIPEGTTLAGFCGIWQPKTVSTLTYIRNALVHGRERKFGLIISPTARNDVLIKPWCHILRRIAEQIIIFGGLTPT